jgi:DNA-directed RNA polymerase subunit RPC12/RpoP
MDLNPQLDLRCPNCNIKIEQRVQRRMNKFWTGLQVAECEGCGSRIQWHHSLRRKLRIGGFIFRVGLFLVFSSFIAFIFEWKMYGSVLVAAGVITTMSGLFATRTPNEQVRVELVNET